MNRVRQLSLSARRWKPASQPRAKIGSNPQMLFPCLDKLEQKTEQLNSSRGSLCFTPPNSLEAGPEPLYLKVVTGFATFHSDKPIYLDNGGYLPEYDLAYETWGTLNKQKLNAVLIHTGLSALSHARSQPHNEKPGWWEKFIGPGSYIDTNKFFVVCTNVLGGCYGLTGPSLRDPADGKVYATRFPIVTVNDMVRAQRELMKGVFGVSKLHALVGALMGGMQSLAYGWEFPSEVGKIVLILGCARLHPYLIALRHCQRQVLMLDPNWNRGFYYDGVPPHIGMKLAREIATVTYRLGPEWEYRFGRGRADELKPPALCPDFLVETYLDHAGEKFSLEYDANSLLYVLKAMDMFDLGHDNRSRALARRARSQEGSEQETSFCLPPEPYQETVDRETVTPEELLEDLRRGMARLRDIDCLVVGVESDILFPVWQQREIAEVLQHNKREGKVEYYELGTDISNFGHDTFLLSMDHFGPHVESFLQ